ncbi:kinectin-like isoform X1 [Archocentrus centrarchus]|uniref:kinectin-like isoform X1 n=1 Tax=Archocentrus centrarchus TaxID=63155 RepID=UPI0011E9DDF2|nr:kinectin-like isoform X1 [Archocentrus centrarchus]XP_030594419.1 kinectin-like isoform X1 [Archocentrus centrarchus]
MDAIEENMSPEEMLEKIAELDYNQSLLRDLNAEMRKWLDAADDDMAVLRSENESLRKQVKALEKLVCDAQQVEAEPCTTLANDLEATRCNEEKIHALEKESTMMREQNKKLTAELKSLQQERDQGKLTLSNLKVTLQALEFQMEEAQSGLQHRDEVIHQKNLLLKHLDETVDEYSNAIKDLRLKNQELRKQLEDRLDEATFDLMREKEQLPSPPLSFAEEIKLLASIAEGKISMADSADLGNCLQEEAEAEELLKPDPHTVNRQTTRCAGTVEAAVHRAGFFMLGIFILMVLAFVASGNIAGKSDLFSINTLWSRMRLMLHPYFSVHYGALPPI